jgi:hydrogenase expression/formation protein HypE
MSAGDGGRIQAEFGMMQGMVREIVKGKHMASTPQRPLPLGKLPADLLATLLSRLPQDPRVVVGPLVGEDATVIDMGDRYLVAKTDPITFATDEIGWYAVQVNANDLATTGATPRWFLATVLLPGGLADAALAERIFDQLVAACADLDITLVGGHTEITYGLDRPLVVGTLLGEVEKEALVTTGGAGPGDTVLLTKGVPIEATAIIAREKHDDLLPHFGGAFVGKAAAYLTDPGISVVRDARIAVASGTVTSMHDPTEGGLATALWELAEASGHGIEVTIDSWPLCPEGAALCTHYGLDPLAAIASGALLLTVKAADEAAITAALTEAGIAVYRLGHVAGGPISVRFQDEEMSRPARDEIARLFE